MDMTGHGPPDLVELHHFPACKLLDVRLEASSLYRVGTLEARRHRRQCHVVGAVVFDSHHRCALALRTAACWWHWPEICIDNTTWLSTLKADQTGEYAFCYTDLAALLPRPMFSAKGYDRIKVTSPSLEFAVLVDAVRERT